MHSYRLSFQYQGCAALQANLIAIVDNRVRQRAIAQGIASSEPSTKAKRSPKRER